MTNDRQETVERLAEIIDDSKLYQGFQCDDYMIRVGLKMQLAQAIWDSLELSEKGISAFIWDWNNKSDWDNACEGFIKDLATALHNAKDKILGVKDA